MFTKVSIVRGVERARLRIWLGVLSVMTGACLWSVAEAVFAAPASVVMTGNSGEPVASQPELTRSAETPADVRRWLERLQKAPHQNSYTGEVEVSIHGRTSVTSTSRIEHVHDAQGHTIDRIESRSGNPRITYRKRDEVLTLWPKGRQAVREKRDPLMGFPNLLQGPVKRLAEFYTIKSVGDSDIAGHAAQVLDFKPRDAWRYSYRIWMEKTTGLPVKIQVRQGDGWVLEQSAFTELELNPAQANARSVPSEQEALKGYSITTSGLQRTQAAREGWRMARPVPGFAAVSCYRRMLDGKRDGKAPNGYQAMQWIFSDGMASVSLFLQPFDEKNHPQEVQLAQGATSILTRRLGDWWLTAVGEVPQRTLQAMAHGLERLP